MQILFFLKCIFAEFVMFVSAAPAYIAMFCVFPFAHPERLHIETNKLWSLLLALVLEVFFHSNVSIFFFFFFLGGGLYFISLKYWPI